MESNRLAIIEVDGSTEEKVKAPLASSSSEDILYSGKTVSRQEKDAGAPALPTDKASKVSSSQKDSRLFEEEWTNAKKNAESVKPLLLQQEIEAKKALIRSQNEGWKARFDVDFSDLSALWKMWSEDAKRDADSRKPLLPRRSLNQNVAPVHAGTSGDLTIPRSQTVALKPILKNTPASRSYQSDPQTSQRLVPMFGRRMQRKNYGLLVDEADENTQEKSATSMTEEHQRRVSHSEHYRTLSSKRVSSATNQGNDSSSETEDYGFGFLEISPSSKGKVQGHAR